MDGLGEHSPNRIKKQHQINTFNTLKHLWTLQHLLTNLTHWGQVTLICVNKLSIIGSDVAWSAPSHYLNQCWNIVNLTIRNKFQWNVNRNSNIFIHENHRPPHLSWRSVRKCIWKCRLRNGGHFISASMCWYLQQRCYAVLKCVKVLRIKDVTFQLNWIFSEENLPFSFKSQWILLIQ